MFNDVETVGFWKIIICNCQLIDISNDDNLDVMACKRIDLYVFRNIEENSVATFGHMGVKWALLN